MTITSAIVLFAVLWFLALFIALPIGIRTQADENDIVPGTPGSAPVESMIRKKMLWATIAAGILWALIFSFIVWGGVTPGDFDPWGRRG